MSKFTLVEQTNPGAQSAGQQAFYPKSIANQSPNGGLARVDATGTERVMLESGSYAAVGSALFNQVNFWGM